MPLLRQFLPACIVAAGVASLVLLILRRWSRMSRDAAAIAIAIGYATGHAMGAGLPSFPPRGATQWLFWFAPIGVVVAAGDALVRPKAVPRMAVWAAVSALAIRLLLQAKFSYTWKQSEGWLWVAALTISLVSLTWRLNLTERAPFGHVALPWTMCIVSTGIAAALILSGSLLLGELAFVLAAGLAVCGGVALVLRPAAAMGNARFPVALVNGGLLLSGYFYAELPASAAVLLTIAPALASFSHPGARHPGWRQLAFQSGAVALPVVIAVLLAYRASPALDY